MFYSAWPRWSVDWLITVPGRDELLIDWLQCLDEMNCWLIDYSAWARWTVDWLITVPGRDELLIDWLQCLDKMSCWLINYSAWRRWAVDWLMSCWLIDYSAWTRWVWRGDALCVRLRLSWRQGRTWNYSIEKKNFKNSSLTSPLNWGYIFSFFYFLKGQVHEIRIVYKCYHWIDPYIFIQYFKTFSGTGKTHANCKCE